MMTRRSFGWLAASAALAQQRPAGSDIGDLYAPVRSLADAAPHELSYLKPQHKDLRTWQKTARSRLESLLHHDPPPVAPDAQVLGRRERDGYVEERISFRTTPHWRVPATVLIPSKRNGRLPGVVALHDHGGFYFWGREKITEVDEPHPVLADFKKRYYEGRSVAAEMARAGYVVIAIDMFYWGERRFQLPEDPPALRERAASLTAQEIADANRRSSTNENITARSIFTAGATWPGILLRDDIRTVDYLASRPEVDPGRLGCVGLSVGGYRSFLLGALDPRIRAAVDVGWMTTFAAQIERHVIHTMGLSFTIPGMYRYFDLPDLSALIAPRALLVMMGSRDQLFPVAAMKAAFEKVEQCYRKAGVPERQRCLMFDAPHEFNLKMQAEAWEWLKRWV